MFYYAVFKLKKNTIELRFFILNIYINQLKTSFQTKYTNDNKDGIQECNYGYFLNCFLLQNILK
jgi:hypothetical protein